MEKEDTGGYTLDNRRNRDNIGKKRCPYNKNKGYMPMLGFIAENDICINDDFRDGNISPALKFADRN